MCWEWRAASQEPGALTAVGLTRGPGPPVCRLRCRCDQGFRPLHTGHWLLASYLRVTGETGVTTTMW